MNVFVERGQSDEEVHRLIRQKYGDQARIMSRREYKEGGFLGMFARRMVEISGYAQQTVFSKSKKNDTEAFQANKEELLQTMKKQPQHTPYQEILDEVKTLRDEIKQNSANTQAQTDIHPSIQRIRKILEDNEFTPSVIAEIEAKLMQQFSLDDLENPRMIDLCVLRWIADNIVETTTDYATQKQIVILIGPTGVGKTTTIAKLAALYGMKYKQLEQLRLITIDNYRIGAVEQIKTYGKIMNIPVFTADSREGVQKTLALQDADSIMFIDTIGKSPNDFQHLGSMRAVLEPCMAQAQVIICVSATTKISDAREIIRQYDIFNIASVIFTKIDETKNIGAVISLLIESQKPLSHITVGQKVPSDILEGGKIKLLERLHGFSLQREEIQSIIEEADIKV